jgi:serine O-acetyltransferase
VTSAEHQPFFATVREDLAATMSPVIPRTPRFWVHVFGKLLLNPRVRAVVTFRISHELAIRRLTPLAMFLRGRMVKVSGAEIHPMATVGPGLHLVHSNGVVIGAFAIIGKNCRVHHGVTVGAPRRSAGGKWGYSTLGDDVTIGTHAVILGAVNVGNGAVIGANAVVTRDVGPGEIVAGVPAVVVGKNEARVGDDLEYD